ncbi:hypothetical protein MMC17_001010 [Xylographa soralifera]|nr:hypothetical protein [Xylographa soralifera]
MSSDLWAAFAQDSQDPSSNPWSQSAADGPTTSEEGHIQNSLTAPSDFFHQPQISKARRLQKSYTPLATTESWPETTNQHENVWGDTQFDNFSDAPWTAPPSSRNEDSRATTTLVADLVASKPEEDDFGDFEEAEAVPQETSPASSQPKATAFHSIFPTTTENNSNSLNTFRTPQNAIDGDVHHDPWAGVESLGNPILPTLGAESSKFEMETSQGESTAGRTFQLVETSVEVPYAAEEWGEFSPDPREAAQTSNTRVSSNAGNGSATVKTNQYTLRQPGHATKETIREKTSKAIDAIPPSNVPPPSILLSFLSNLVVALPVHITKIIVQGPTTKVNPVAVSNAQADCRLAFRVAGRIITGRKLRWKRDIHLSQSMKIGPASAGRSGGMKLTGVDRAETQREDREAVEIVRVWKANLGSIRAALTASNGQAKGQPLVLPDISEQMLMRRVTAAEGGVTATKCCFLCGLKRDERIVSLDGEVSDSLGEWWAEHWGHIECQSFWAQYEELLPKRG